MSESTDQVRRTFNKLRARLFTMVESMPLTREQQEAYKKTVKDATSNAWNDITELVEGKEE